MTAALSIQRPPSRQDYESPPDLIAAVERRFGLLTMDLACTPGNAKAPDGITLESSAPWPREGRLWCNPPFRDADIWAARCAAWKPLRGGRLLLLTPASIGSNWFRDHVHGRAMVLALNPRITFVGCDAPFPKDCMLSVFGDGPGFDVWRWK